MHEVHSIKRLQDGRIVRMSSGFKSVRRLSNKWQSPQKPLTLMDRANWHLWLCKANLILIDLTF